MTAEQKRCRHCNRLDVDAHRPWCIHAAQEPPPDDPAVDERREDEAEDAYHDALIGER